MFDGNESVGTMRTLRVLHLEDDSLDADLVRSHLNAGGVPCDIVVAIGKESFESQLTLDGFDLILIDYNHPLYDGLQALKQARAIQPDVPVILISGTVDDDEVARCLSIGATDYLLKDRLERLVPAAQRAVKEAETRLARRRADAAVRDERDRAQQYLDAAEVILLGLDVDGHITLLNRYACSLLGWSAAELLGRSWIDVCLPERIRAASWAAYPSLLKGERLLGEAPVRCRSGEERLVEWRNTTLSDAAGRVIGTFSSGTDITERRLAETQRQLLADEAQIQATALQEADRRTNYALGAALMGIWELDLVTFQLTWSETMAALYGLSTDQGPSTAQAFMALIHQDDRRAVEMALADAVLKGADFDVEFRVIWPDGSAHWHSGRARVMHDAKGAPTRVLGVEADISERKSLQEQFRQAQKMEAVGLLAGGVAHDFNNMLTVILGYSNFVLETLGSQDRRRLDLEEVIKAGQRATALTRQLLAFSRKQVLQATAVDLNQLVRGILPMLGRLIGETVELVTDLKDDMRDARADTGQVEQVLLNLVVNARDAMPSGGRLTLETGMAELHGSLGRDVVVRPGAYVMLAVRDNGVGMDEKTQERLFEPFFTTKPPGKGTGLGLATAYGIIKQSGGYIDVDSRPGDGSVFKVYLPCADASTAAKPARLLEVSGRAGTEGVLIVEDESAVRALIGAVLERSGYRVFEAANVEQAEVLCRLHRDLIKLLITDVIMPGLCGPALFERLAEQHPALKVLYVSGYTDDTIAEKGQLKPGVEFLQKPFTAETLSRRVRETLDHREPLPSVGLSVVP